MTTQAIEAWIEKHKGVHNQEIGLRVGAARSVLTELLRYRQRDKEARARFDDKCFSKREWLIDAATIFLLGLFLGWLLALGWFCHSP